jgi:hypothetical protein
MGKWWKQQQANKEFRKLRRKNWKKNKWNRVLVSTNGEPCPRCATPTEVWQHKEITPELLNQASYYDKWRRCGVKTCKTDTIMSEEDRVWNNNWIDPPAKTEEARRFVGVQDQLKPPWE